MADTPPPPPEGFTVVGATPPPPEGFTVVPEPKAPPPPPGFTLTPEEYKPSATDYFFEQTAPGRIVKALGAGMSEGWGTGRLGLSDESAQALRDIGVFAGVDAGWRDSGRLFTEALVRPAAVAFDALARGTSAIITGVAGAGGQAAQEAGMEPAEANRLVRDLRMLGETAATIVGTEVPAGPPRIKGRVLGSEATKLDAPVVPEGTVAQRPFAGAPEAPKPSVLQEVSAEEAARIYAGGLDNLPSLTEGAGRRYYVIRDDAGDPAAFAAISVKDGAARVDDILGVDEIESGGVKRVTTAVAGDTTNAVGPALVRKALSEFRAQNPDVTSIGGNRVSGARTAGEYVPADDGAEMQIRLPQYAAASSKPPTKTAPETANGFFDKADDGPVDRAGNINLSRIESSEDVKDVIREVAAKNNDFMDARRGVVSVEQTHELAAALGMTPEELAKRKVGEAYNAHEIDAARDLLVQSASDLREAGVKAASGTEADLLAYAEAEARHEAIQGQVAGITAEAGRALNIFKVMKESAEKQKAIAQIMERFGGAENVALRAKMIADLETPQQVSKFLRDSRKATTGEMLREIYVQSVLSGLRTQNTNIISNFTNVFWSPVETAVAATVGKVRELGGNTGERVVSGEVKARLYGIVQGSKEGVILGRKAFRDEVSMDGISSTETPAPRAVPGKLGSVIRIPGRSLMAVDEYFKAVARRQELNSLAYRKASKEGLTGEEFSARVNDLVENPTKTMKEKAQDFALRQTFQTELGTVGKALQSISNANLLGKMVVTFVRAPINILKYANEMTPLGLFSKEVRANLKGENGKPAQDLQIAKLAAGSSILVTAYSLAAEGMLTGAGPKDPAERAMWMLSGKQPYSVRIGDYYYSHRALGPFSVLLGAAADSHEIRERWDEADGEKIAAMMLASVTNNIVNQSWARGAAGFLQAVQDPTRYGDRYIQQLSGVVVPNLVAQIAQSQDPYLREVRSVLDGLKVRAGFPDSVKPMRDIWGEPILREGSLGPDILSPVFMRKVSEDPVNKEMTALQIWPAKLERDIKGVKLTEQQYDEYQRVAGRLAKYQLDRIVGMDGWQDVPAFARVETIKRTINHSREAARRLLVLEHPEILRQMVDKKLKDLGPAVPAPAK